MAHGADLLNRNKNKLAAKHAYLHSLLQWAGRVHIDTESDRRQQGDGGKERAGRSQEVGKENETGVGGLNGWQLPHVRIGISPLRAMLPCWEAGKKRETEKEGHRKQWQVSLCISLSPPSFHTIYRQTAESSPWATGHVVYSLRGCSVFLFFIPFIQCYIIEKLHKGEKSFVQDWVHTIRMWCIFTLAVNCFFFFFKF